MLHLLKKTAKKYIRRREEWTIGIYTGNSPLELKPHPQANNPVLTADDITDINADFVADPFMVEAGGCWYMFFEVLDLKDELGKIALATSQDGVNWAYHQTVLEEPFHMSYPYVFNWQGEYYMVPETYQDKSIRLYQATEFPNKWTCVSVLLNDRCYVDATLFRYHEQWWMFSCQEGDNNTLYLHSADSLEGPWREHPQSPLVKGDASRSRPAGRVIALGDRLFRYAQDCEDVYGKQVNAFEITELTKMSYCEKALSENPILEPQRNTWKSMGMHTVDAHPFKENWIACVDGRRSYLVLRSSGVPLFKSFAKR